MQSLVSAEDKTAKVGATFYSPKTAQVVAQTLRHQPESGDYTITLLAPDDTQWELKLEPEQSSIRKTLLRSHWTMLAMGLLAGVLVFIALIVNDIAAVVQNPGMALLAMLWVGGMCGLLCGGLFTLRPDHDGIISLARTAKNYGQWMVVVHSRSNAAMDRAKNIMEPSALAIRSHF